jgi:ABC-type transport system involved in multi-copper enzyme maturation permease subunit
MPLYDLSYRRFDGPRRSQRTRCLVIARSAAALLLKKRSFLLLLAAAWIPVVVRAGQIYVDRQFPGIPDFFEVGTKTWRQFLSQQVLLLPVVLVSLYTGASAIASDVASGALVVYLSKPVSRLDYAFGKLLPVAGSIAFVTLVPALVLYFLQLALAPDLGFFFEAPWLPLAIVAYSLWLASFFSLAVLVLSSVCRSGRLAGAGFAALVFGGDALTAVLSSPPPYLGVFRAAMDSAYWFFADTASGQSPRACLFVMASLMVVFVLVLSRRLQSQETLQ